MLRIVRGRNVRKGMVLLRLSDCEDNIRRNSNDISYMPHLNEWSMMKRQASDANHSKIVLQICEMALQEVGYILKSNIVHLYLVAQTRIVRQHKLVLIWRQRVIHISPWNDSIRSKNNAYCPRYNNGSSIFVAWTVRWLPSHTTAMTVDSQSIQVDYRPAIFPKSHIRHMRAENCIRKDRDTRICMHIQIYYNSVFLPAKAGRLQIMEARCGLRRHKPIDTMTRSISRNHCSLFGYLHMAMQIALHQKREHGITIAHAQVSPTLTSSYVTKHVFYFPL
jgi:hypothetical protein